MRRFLFIVAALTLMSAPAGATGQDTDWNRYTLEDLGGVFIRIEVNDVCEEAGITASTYEAVVSLRLIEADVGVLTRQEMLEHPAMPELRISLDCADGSNGASGTLAYSVGLRVQQAAQMLRDTQITLAEAVTWYSTRVGVASSSGAAEAIGAVLTEEVGAFAEVWAAVHAEEGGAK